MDWSEVGKGAQLILVGMAVVFAGLLILMLAIMVVNRLARKKAEEVEGSSVIESMSYEADEKEKIAVLAAALAMAMKDGREAGADRTEAAAEGMSNGPSRWAVAGREQAMRSRGKAGRQWGRHTS